MDLIRLRLNVIATYIDALENQENYQKTNICSSLEELCVHLFSAKVGK
jgi:hypothetical protein